MINILPTLTLKQVITEILNEYSLQFSLIEQNGVSFDTMQDKIVFMKLQINSLP